VKDKTVAKNENLLLIKFY